MNSLRFINTHIASPIKDLREYAQMHFLKKTRNNGRLYLEQLRSNLKSSNLSLVDGSLEVIEGLSAVNARAVLPLVPSVKEVAKKHRHYKIRCSAIRILKNCGVLNVATTNLLTPKKIINQRKMTSAYGYDNCEYGTFLQLGGRANEHLLRQICEAFRFKCKIAVRELRGIRKRLGYNEKEATKERVPKKYERYGTYYDGDDTFRTTKYLLTYHAINILVLNCLKNRKITINEWEHLQKELNEYDPSFLKQYLSNKPAKIYCPPLKRDTFLLDDKVKDVYADIHQGDGWTRLYENTNIRHDDFSFHKTISSCFAGTNLSGRVGNVQPVHLQTWTKYNLIEAPFGDATIDSHANPNGVTLSLSPSYGEIKEDYSGVEKIFPAKDIIQYFNLTPRDHGTIYVDQNGKEILKCVNWINGYEYIGSRDGGNREFQIAENGALLLIRTTHLQQYLTAKKLRYIAQAYITKSIRKNYKSEYKSRYKNYKSKTITF